MLNFVLMRGAFCRGVYKPKAPTNLFPWVLSYPPEPCHFLKVLCFSFPVPVGRGKHKKSTARASSS